MPFFPNASSVVVFYDPLYPQLCQQESLKALVPGPFQLVNAADLTESLQAADCTFLLSFHGPYFPKACWTALLTFLERGGNLAVFGGMPFTRPIDEYGHIEPEQEAYLRQLYLGSCRQVECTTHELELVADEHALALKKCTPITVTGEVGTFWACSPRLTQVNDHADELGSAGPFDTVLQPLLYALVPSTSSPSGKRRIATPAFLLDQRSGRFRGGRWLISAWQPSSETIWLANMEAIQQFIGLAAEGPTMVEVRPTLACYQPGEAPSLLVDVLTKREMHVHIVLSQQKQEENGTTFDLDFAALPVRQERVLRLPAQQQPGLYRVTAEYYLTDGHALSCQSGFWVWDEALVAATQGKRLTAGRDAFYQGDRLFFVYGTTYMDSRVQRKFLHLPNPVRWDHDIAEIKATGINLIRTGIWTAWRDLMSIAGVVNEAFLRALDAFIMTMCKHDIQLIFTFFSFFPPLFEGENPWLDPRSVEGQQSFVALLARRYARVELLFWDLINEPSFGDPREIFALRPLPHDDRFERVAFQRWLAKRHSLSELQLRWRQTPSQMPDWHQVSLPTVADFETTSHNVQVRAFFKVADYTHFSQDVFCAWATRLRETIHMSGGQALVGVGQDEAGARLAPQFYASAVDYTTTHPWWNIDDLLWDMLLDKTPEKPNLIQEVGVMQLLDLDGRAWRSEQENALLLERKLVMGMIARGAGLIQWLWHTNGYMTSENENNIGLLRTDGSAKPELAVIEDFARLVRVLQGRMFETTTCPEVWIVIPYAQWFARPASAREGTQKAVRVLGYELGLIPQMVGEYALTVLITEPHHPRVVIVPAAQLLDRGSWQILLEYMQKGGTLLINGVIARDAHNLPFDPQIEGITESESFALPVSRHEHLTDTHGRSYPITFADEKVSTVKKAHNQIRRYRHGAGIFVWCGLPLELANETAVLNALYRQVLPQTGIVPQETAGILVSRRAVQDGTLVLAASESSSPHQLLLQTGLQVTLEPDRAGAILLENDGTIHAFGGVSYSRDDTYLSSEEESISMTSALAEEQLSRRDQQQTSESLYP